MRTLFSLIIAVSATLMITGVIVFRYALDLPWIDAFYFMTSTVTTVGYGDITLKEAEPPVKLFGSFLMLSFPAMMAAIIGLMVDYLLKVNLEEVLAPWRRRMKGHVVVCGLSNVGIRIVEHLVGLGQQVIAIEPVEDSRFVEQARKLKVPVILGDIRRPAVLEKAHIADAAAVVAAGDDDLVNLEVGLNAREVNDDIRVVLRVFDHNLADKIRSAFSINTAFSTSALAAPAFAMAALDPEVVGSYYIGDQLMLIVEMAVATDSHLDGHDTSEVYHDENLSILCHESGGTGQRTWHPADAIPLKAGDKLTVTAAYDVYGRIKELNR